MDGFGEIEFDEIVNMPDATWVKYQIMIKSGTTASPIVIPPTIIPRAATPHAVIPTTAMAPKKVDGIQYFMVLLFFLTFTSILLTAYPILYPDHNSPISGAFYVFYSVIGSGVISIIILLFWEYGRK
jgi:hypothetical protein